MFFVFFSNYHLGLVALDYCLKDLRKKYDPHCGLSRTLHLLCFYLALYTNDPLRRSDGPDNLDYMSVKQFALNFKTFVFMTKRNRLLGLKESFNHYYMHHFTIHKHMLSGNDLHAHRHVSS